MSNLKPQTQAEYAVESLSNDEKRALKVPSYYHFGDRILEIRESKFTGHLKDEMREQYGVTVEALDDSSTDKVDKKCVELQNKYPGMKIHTAGENTNTTYFFPAPAGTSEARIEKVKSAITCCDTVPAWDVVEYEQTTDMDGNKKIEAIMQMNGVHAQEQLDVLRMFECMASKPFLVGGSIERAFDRDKNRKRLDSIIADAQMEYEREQEAIRQAAIAAQNVNGQ